MAGVYLVGLAVVDFVFSVDKFPAGGDKFQAGDARIVSGGCAANAAVAVSRLGGAAALAARVGDDLVADLIAAEMAAEGVHTGGIHRTAGGRSSFSAVYLDRAGERQIVNFRGAGLGGDAGWLALPPDTAAVLTDNRWHAGMRAALALARQKDVPGIVDAEVLSGGRSSLAQATHVAFSRQGLQSLAPQERDAARALAAVRPLLRGWACVTDGENGVFFTAKKTIENIPAWPVKVRDTLAAGDVWHGAFALRLAEGADEEAAVTFANAAAALKCAAGGGRDGCPRRRAVENFLRAKSK